jgi:hypothetical protein
MRWLLVAGLTILVLSAIIHDARRDDCETRRACVAVGAVLAGTVVLATAVMSRWVFGADVY